MPVSRRVLLVDADVARSCGRSERPPAVECLQVLETILTVCHKTMLPVALGHEWRRHASAVAWNWLKRMTRRGKLVPCAAPDRNTLQRGEDLRRRVERKMGRRPWTEDERGIIRKDLHLVQAAVENGAVVLSRDEQARRLFDRLAAAMPELRRVPWVNPTGTGEPPTKWLEGGAPDSRERHLGGTGP